MDKKFKRVMFLSIFLNIFSLLLAETGTHKYTQSVMQEVEFTLEVDGNIKVSADDLNFGDIVRGNTGDIKASTNVKVEIGDKQAHKIKARFLQSGDTIFENKTGYKEITIKYVEQETGGDGTGTKKKEAPSADTEQGEIDTLKVKLQDFKDEYDYEAQTNELDIPIYGTISGVPENQKLGNYSGYVTVEIEVDGNEQEGGEITTK